MRIADVVTHHRARLDERRVRAAALARTDLRLSRMRLAAVGAGVGLGTAAYLGALSAWWLVVPAAVFLGLMQVHDRAIRSHEAAARAMRWYEWGLARLEDRWPGEGSGGERFLDDDHPYARDLDLFGPGSLFQLVSTAQTSVGEETLAGWLLGGADPDEVRARQEAVTDLTDRVQLREDLYTRGVDARRAVDSDRLRVWATAPTDPGWPPLRRGASALAAGLLVSSAAWLVGWAPGQLPLVWLLLNWTLAFVTSGRSARVLHGASEPARELTILTSVLARLREERFVAPRLQQLHRDLVDQGGDPIAAARRLDRVLQMHDWQHNLFFSLPAAALLWAVHCAAAVDAWRGRHGSSVGGWLSTAGELEALTSLATFRFERPDLVFPEILAATTPPVFEAERLVHPLLSRERAVANDIRLGPTPQLVIVSGSNMSGKTTLLRTVGVGAVLALAGAPVSARRLRISPVAIGGTLRIQDSLQAGRSRFYAEILRVRQIVEVARDDGALLFLMDELFHGTNSHDRVEGAHGVLRFLVDLGAVGMVTTHDLALSAIGDRLGPTAANVHFDDRLVDGQLSFDYVLKPGRATHGNALALMRAVGLEVELTERR